VPLGLLHDGGEGEVLVDGPPAVFLPQDVLDGICSLLGVAAPAGEHGRPVADPGEGCDLGHVMHARYLDEDAVANAEPPEAVARTLALEQGLGDDEAE